MSDNTDNLVLAHLRAIRSTLEQHTLDLREIKGRFGNLEAQYANISQRVDRIDDRLARVQSRIGLIEIS